MNAMTQLRSQTTVLPAKKAAPAVLAQRKSTLGGSAAAAPLLDGGRPISPAVRHEMESGFGRDFSNVRVHDDARAHDSARELGALAYTVGDHVVFGHGQYAPDTPSGRALIAHELAHTVQQGGVQLKADGPLDTSVDDSLELQADRAAEAVTAGRQAPALSYVGRPMLARANGPKAAATASNSPPKNLPAWVIQTVNDDPADSAPRELIVVKDNFKMPVEKGAGGWVKDAYDKTNFASTVYATDRKSAFKEDSQTEQYRNMWLGKYGFKSLAVVSSTILKLDGKKPAVTTALGRPGVRPFVKKLAGGLAKSESAIDHIVEKHMGGSSVPENLQLHDSKRNSASGSQSWNKVKELVDDLMAPGMRGESAKKIQIQFNRVSLADETPPDDATFRVEELLRAGEVEGDAAIKQAAAGEDVVLKAGVNHAVAPIKAQGVTEIPTSAARCVSGAYLLEYHRQGKKSKHDVVTGELDNRALKKMGKTPKNKAIQFKAVIETAEPAAAKSDDQAGGTEEAQAVGEVRRLSVDDTKQKVPFEYLYLSPGHLETVRFDEKGNLTGEGVIAPSLPILGKLNVAIAPDKFDLIKSIDVKSLNQSAFVRPLSAMFRFTRTDLKIDLLRFKPEGSMEFTIGPEKKPLVLGKIDATVQSGAFVANGQLTPGVAIPGLEGASGNVTYHSTTGWKGNITASSSKIKNTKLDVTLGFEQEGKGLKVSAVGGLKATLPGDKEIELEAFWGQGNLGFRTRKPVRWVKPLQMVDYLEVGALFVNGHLKVNGKGGFTFRKDWHGDIEITYERSATGADKFYGKGSVNVVTPNKKGKGKVTVEVDEEGRVYGSGRLTYIFTTKPLIEPQVEVTLDKKGQLSIAAAVTLEGPYEIFPRYPKSNKYMKDMVKNSPVVMSDAPADSGLKKLIEFSTPKIRIPTPIPTVNGFLEFYAGVFYEIYFGPGALKMIKLSGKISDLTENPQVEAKIEGRFVCEAGAGLYGRFGGYAGVEVLYGAGELKGGVHLQPGIKGDANIDIPVVGEYKNGDFSVKVSPQFNIKVVALLDVSGTITASAFWGFTSKTWPFKIAHWEKFLTDKKIALPSLDLSISANKGLPGAEAQAELPKLSPIEMIKDLISGKKGDTAPRDPTVDPNRPPPRDHVGNKV